MRFSGTDPSSLLGERSERHSAVAKGTGYCSQFVVGPQEAFARDLVRVSQGPVFWGGVGPEQGLGNKWSECFATCLEPSKFTEPVLNAIGRIGGKHPEIMPKAVALINDPTVQSELEPMTAALILAMQGSDAKEAIPAAVSCRSTPPWCRPNLPFICSSSSRRNSGLG
jgi:hypothetical protein